jgi:hypothetical protein
MGSAVPWLRDVAGAGPLEVTTRMGRSVGADPLAGFWMPLPVQPTPVVWVDGPLAPA